MGRVASSAAPRRVKRRRSRRRVPDLLAELPSLPGYDPVATAAPSDWFDEDLARRAIAFFAECLRHEKGEWAGRPFELLPWQQSIVANLVGWKRTDGTRRYRKAYIEIPRKNGKSHLIAGIGLLMLFCDGESGAEVYCCAGDRAQAAIVGNAARGMVRMESELASRSEVFRNTIVVPATSSKLEILSADADLKHGLNCSCLLYDELHTAPNRDLWDVMLTSMGARRQPLAIAITTAGTSRNSICWEQHEYAEKVRDGVIDDPSFLPVIYAAPASMSFDDPEAWRIANPSLGETVKIEFLQAEAKRAREQPQYEIAFRTLFLNQWCSVQRRWIAFDRWRACRSSFTLEELSGRDCYVGLDLSTTTDLSVVSLLVPMDGGSFRVWPLIYAPEERADIRERQDRVPYRTWAQQGHMRLTPGNVVDYEFIQHDILQIASRMRIILLGYDPWNAQMLANAMQSEGVPLVEVRQGYRTLSEPTKRFESLVLSGKLEHPGNPVLDWSITNVGVDMDPAGNIKPSKSKSTERIDPVSATITALAAAMNEGQEANVYQERGLLSFG